MKQFEFRQSSLQQTPCLCRRAMNIAISSSYIMEQELREHCGVEAEVKRAHILHLNCDMQMNFPDE
jgi:hypothetical protein